MKMSPKKEENLLLLLKNFLNSQKNMKMSLIYSRQGQLLSKLGRVEMEMMDDIRRDEIYRPILILVENLLEEIIQEHKNSHYGSGSFETPQYLIIYIEAGPEAILFCICNLDVNLSQLFPITYLVAEKIAKLLEDSFDFKFNSLKIPDLTFHNKFSLELEQYSTRLSKPIFDHVYYKHHFKKERGKKRIFKVIILGSRAVGKTTLVNRLIGNEEISEYRPTIGISISSYNYHIQGLNEETISFFIYDLAGHDFFKEIRQEYYQGADYAFIMFDLTQRETFNEAISFWYQDARRILGNIPFILIGNKLDLEQKREISKKEGQKIVDKINSLYIETSALNNINVKDTFKVIGIQLYLDQLIKESQSKTDIISQMSHELRTPLNSIIGFTDLLLEQVYGNLNKSQQDFLNDIKESSEFLLEMIKRILDISRIEAGKLPINKHNFLLADVIRQIKSSIEPLYIKKGLSFHIIGLDPERDIYADPFIFKEILYNLLSNAIKFTNEGSITLRIIEKPYEWEFQVIDTGIGIAKDNFDLIFKEFGRIENQNVKEVSGTGLGLALTKKLVNLHRGEMWFESELNKGTTFFITITKEIYNEKKSISE